MEPFVLRVGPGDALDSPAEQRVAEVLARGGVVVFPTETFYGLAVRCDAPEAVSRLLAMKDRPAGQAIPLVAADLDTVRSVAHLPAALEPLALRWWPGPLTLALPAAAGVDRRLWSVDGTLGVRVSGHAVARAVARQGGGLVTATSANLRGRPAVTSVQELDSELLSRVDLVVDGGVTPGGLPSTVVGLDDRGGFVVHRAGAIPGTALEAALR